jgi:hypothetical protein
MDEHYVYGTGAAVLQVCDVFVEDYNIVTPVPYI